MNETKDPTQGNEQKKTAAEQTVKQPTAEAAPQPPKAEKPAAPKTAAGEKDAKAAQPSKDAEINELKMQIVELEGRVAALKNDYARAYADTENTRKRLNNEFEQRSKYRIQDFALDILPVIDNCERALAQETKDEAYRKGVQMIYSQLIAALKKEGVTEIEAKGKPFDPNWHQALMSEKKEGVKPGTVIEVLQKGYKLKDRMLRAAMVKVSE